MKLESAISAGCVVVAIAATIWGGVQPSQSRQPNSNIDIDALFASPNSPGAIAIGVAEGTRTKEGKKTKYYSWHLDPGNGADNFGTFSYQHEADSPEEADSLQLVKLRKFSHNLVKQAQAMGITLTEFELVAAADLFNQSEAAGHDWLGHFKDFQGQPDAVLQARVQSYFKPDGTLDAPGLGNSIEKVRLDQQRRLDAIASVISPGPQPQPNAKPNPAPKSAVFTHPAPGSTFTSGFYPCINGQNCRIHPLWGEKVGPMEHLGVDFANVAGTSVFASQSGTVEIGETKCTLENPKCGAGHGNHLRINGLTINGTKYTTFYGHLHKIFVADGEPVKQGQKIGEMGNTGASTSVHLHWEVWLNGKPVDPLKYLKVDRRTELFGKSK